MMTQRLAQMRLQAMLEQMDGDAKSQYDQEIAAQEQLRAQQEAQQEAARLLQEQQQDLERELVAINYAMPNADGQPATSTITPDQFMPGGKYGALGSTHKPLQQTGHIYDRGAFGSTSYVGETPYTPTVTTGFHPQAGPAPRLGSPPSPSVASSLPMPVILPGAETLPIQTVNTPQPQITLPGANALPPSLVNTPQPQNMNTAPLVPDTSASAFGESTPTDVQQLLDGIQKKKYSPYASQAKSESASIYQPSSSSGSFMSGSGLGDKIQGNFS